MNEGPLLGLILTRFFVISYVVPESIPNPTKLSALIGN
jgi:hypothetical protein